MGTASDERNPSEPLEHPRHYPRRVRWVLDTWWG